MKTSRYIAFPLAYAACLLLLANQAQAKAATEQVEDVTNWTKDQVQAYLNKYQITYDKSDESLLETAKRYRDAAASNANIFINDQANSITRLLDGVKIKLEKNYNLATNQANALMNDLSHELKQLELSGSLTQDKVKRALDQYQHKALKQKYLTEAQYKELANDIQSSFAHPTWYQRIFGTGPANHFYDDSSFHTWLTTSVVQRLQENKELTKDEINSVTETLKKAIMNTSNSIQDLATPSWWKQLANDLESQGKLKKDQAQQVADSLKEEVIAYKIFAMDYAGETKQKSQNLFAAATQYIKDTGNGIYQAVVHPLKKQDAYASSALSTASSAASSATDAAAWSASSAAGAASSAAGAAADYVTDAAASATDAAASATDAAASSASVLRSKATQSAYDAKNSFGRFWRQKEMETYRKIGYTEAHIDWIENYLSKTFHEKSNFAKDSVQSAINTVRQYLIQAKVQTAAHIDSQLKSLEGLIEHWRRHTVRDEL
ncbi:uncharacterized protein B0P05DRAFT_537708 [Gilbertella persicaria]|uniref:Uncharacterized protein n=1 Tax=Rhizopus stolonifer TaxID=4846 RepID=A0A367KP72_RHIST|nr:uncharacterized protein B0P05DRAFT_537708 [Gilbertella persicaria]KAI8082604.1 hypothetical protein B0P05DRAFT_537708 [Gilbertella persicaria]RCI04035.1 hypothetical protein CU098_011730 [Rhizopus stolonifer]